MLHSTIHRSSNFSFSVMTKTKMSNTEIKEKSIRSSGKNSSKSSTRFYGIKYLEDKTNHAIHHSPLANISVDRSKEYFRSVYGPLLCTLLLTSTFTFITGATLSLAGYYVPSDTVRHFISVNATTTEQDDKTTKYNMTLHYLRISGIALLSIGGISMSALILTPFLCLRRNEYSQLCERSPTHHTVPISSSSGNDPTNHPGFIVVKQHIQPRVYKKSSKRDHHPSSSKCKQDQKSDSKSTKRVPLSNSKSSEQDGTSNSGVLSPELDRAPIFVSDAQNRIRSRSSSSSGSKLSPDSLAGYRTASCNSLLDITSVERPLVRYGSSQSLK